MRAGRKAADDCIKVFSETDQTDDLKRIDVPTLIMHGDDDQDRGDRRVGDAVVEDGEGATLEMHNCACYRSGLLWF